jgi:general secretion pathway protein C
VQILAARFVEPAKIILIIAIAALLANTLWYFFSGPDVNAVTKVEKKIRPATRTSLSIEQIAAMNLFGQATDVPQTVEPSAFDAPETRLRLTLEGVFQADNPEQSAAIVAEQNKPGELYLVGENLPGNAVLAEVYSDRIVLRRGAVFETLRFTDEPALITTANLPRSNNTAGQSGNTELYDETEVRQDNQRPGRADDASADAGSFRDTVERYKSRLNEDAEGTLGELGLEPVSTDSAEGYRLGNLASSPYLAQTGLQPGDVIVSVNGRPVGDVQQDQLEIDNIVAQGSARLEVQRGQRRFFVTASLK